MDNSAGQGRAVSFHAPLLAGRTNMDRERHDWINRPAGMDAWILNCTVAGQGRINRGPDMLLCGPGDLLLFPPHVAHDYEMSQRAQHWVHLWVYFVPRASWGPYLSWPPVSNGVRRVRVEKEKVFRRVRQRMEEIVGLSRGRLPQWYEFCVNALEEVLLWCSNIHRIRSGGHIDERIETVLGFINDHFSSSVGVPELTRRSGLSVSRFAHLFTEQVGMSPARYLECHRIGEAQQLLVGTARSISAIAYEVGYEDPLHFSRVFRRHTGRSPRQFRRSAW